MNTPEGLRYCPAIVAANGRIKPDWIFVDGKEARHPEGADYIDSTNDDGKRIRTSASSHSILIEPPSARAAPSLLRTSKTDKIPKEEIGEMGYTTRVLSKLQEAPEFDELAAWVRQEHAGCRLTIEQREEDFGREDDNASEGWSSLLLSTDDEVEIALVERLPVYDGSEGQDEIADLLEDARDARPESAREWLEAYLPEIKTLYSFRHLQGADSDLGSAALHGLRSQLWERGEAILQADLEGFTNEEGYNILWQFADTVSGAWNMAVLEEGTWHNFLMDLGDPDQREAFWHGEAPVDAPRPRRRI